MFVVEKKKEGLYSLPAMAIEPAQAKILSSSLAIRIVALLTTNELYPVEIAKKLKVHEQKIYYHVKNLHKAGIIKQVKEESLHGAVARYFTVNKPAVIVKLKELEPAHNLFQSKADTDFLAPFIKDGQLHALIIVGSPDPHGVEKARSRDGYYGMDLALFIGTFLNNVPQLYVKLDTEVRQEDLKNNNLIIIGGPVVNKVTEQVNTKLPIKFEKNEQWSIKSSLSNTLYPSDESGLIVKAKSPFNANNSLLLVAGKRFSGTRAAIVTFLKHFEEIQAGNVYNRKVMAKVVEGLDFDSDGIIDDAEIRE